MKSVLCSLFFTWSPELAIFSFFGISYYSWSEVTSHNALIHILLLWMFDSFCTIFTNISCSFLTRFLIYFWDVRLHFRLCILTFYQMYDVHFFHMASNHNIAHISPRNKISMSKRQLSSWLNCGSIHNSHKMIGGLTKCSANFQRNAS